MRPVRLTLAAAVATLALALLAVPARADVPPPDAEPCLSKKVGDGCAYQGKSGSCAARTCTRTTPAGDTSTYDCLLCVPGAADDGGCNVGAARPLAPWVLGGALGVVVLRWRRRRR
jgi:hypothetical protein